MRDKLTKNMIFWIVAALVTAVILALLARPLFANAAGAADLDAAADNLIAKLARREG